MIKSYNLEDSELSFHKKLYTNYTNLLDFIHKDFKDLNPILSGSAAISLTIAPSVDFNDYDFYFKSEEDYNNSKEFLFKNNFDYKTETKNCIVFNNKKNGKDIQLIKTFYGGVNNVINNHDFVNCALAFQEKTLFLKKESLVFWKKKELQLQNIQCNPKLYLNSNFNDLEISNVLGYITNLMQRIEKYSQRYDLTFNQKSIQMLKPFRDYLLRLNVNKKHENKKIYFTHNVYYALANKTISYDIYINRFLKLLNVPLSFTIVESKNDLYYYFDLTTKRDENENILFE